MINWKAVSQKLEIRDAQIKNFIKTIPKRTRSDNLYLDTILERQGDHFMLSLEIMTNIYAVRMPQMAIDLSKNTTFKAIQEPIMP